MIAIDRDRLRKLASIRPPNRAASATTELTEAIPALLDALEQAEAEREKAQVELIAEQHRAVELLDRACAAERDLEDAQLFGVAAAKAAQLLEEELDALQARPSTPDALEAAAERAADQWTDEYNYAKTGPEWGAFGDGYLAGVARSRQHVLDDLATYLAERGAPTPKEES